MSDFPGNNLGMNSLGVKGMSELGIVGIPAGHRERRLHATGKRIRELPITPDKLLCATQDPEPFPSDRSDFTEAVELMQ